MNNIVFSVLHLYQASNLLKYKIPDVSDTLLKLANSIIQNENVSQESINSLSSLVDQIKSPIESNS